MVEPARLYSDVRCFALWVNAVGRFSGQIRQKIAKNMWQLMIPFFCCCCLSHAIYHIVYFGFIHRFIFLYLYQMVWQIKNYDSLLILLMCRVLAPYGVKRLVFIVVDHYFRTVFSPLCTFALCRSNTVVAYGIWISSNKLALKQNTHKRVNSAGNEIISTLLSQFLNRHKRFFWQEQKVLSSQPTPIIRERQRVRID